MSVFLCFWRISLASNFLLCWVGSDKFWVIWDQIWVDLDQIQKILNRSKKVKKEKDFTKPVKMIQIK